MAQQIQVSRPFGLQRWLIVAGVAIVAPYVLNRFFGLLNFRGLGNVTANDVALAGKDGVRDAADDMNVGGVSGKIKRTAGRVVDHLNNA
jgi:hypothetical protein